MDEFKYFECDNCIAVKIAKDNNSVFMRLPFPVECEDNVFGKPVEKMKPDISSMTPEQLNKFIKQCDTIQEQLGNNTDKDDDQLAQTLVNSKYYNIKKFNKIKYDKESSFGLVHVNIASLNAHIDDLRTVLSRLDFNFDVIGISEHKIKKDVAPSNNIDIPGYDEFVFEPTETTHGGAGFYIRNDYDSLVRKDLRLNLASQFEAIFVEIILKDRKNLVVGCVYRHPSSDIPITEFAEKHLEPIINKISKEKKECMLMGDFNIDLLKSGGDNTASKFYNNLTSYFFTPFILQPSRLRSKTLIDNIFFNSLEYHSYSGNLLIELSDHLTQFVILEGYIKERNLPETAMLKKDFKQFNEREFEELVVNGLNWEEICMIRIGDSNASFKSFHDTLNFHIDEMVPSRQVTLKQFRLMLKPWITKDILKKCDERDSLLKELKEENDPIRKKILRTNYNALRNQVTKEKTSK